MIVLPTDEGKTIIAKKMPDPGILKRRKVEMLDDGFQIQRSFGDGDNSGGCRGQGPEIDYGEVSQGDGMGSLECL